MLCLAPSWRRAPRTNRQKSRPISPKPDSDECGHWRMERCPRARPGRLIFGSADNQDGHVPPPIGPKSHLDQAEERSVPLRLGRAIPVNLRPPAALCTALEQATVASNARPPLAGLACAAGVGAAPLAHMRRVHQVEQDGRSVGLLVWLPCMGLSTTAVSTFLRRTGKPK